MKSKKLMYKPKAYWKEAIGFDVEKEFQIYQYLCGNLRSTRKIKRIDKEKRFRSYKSWREYVEGNLRKYDRELLNEFYHFLKLNEMKCDIDGGMDVSFIFPFVAALFSGGLIQAIFLISTGESISIDFGFINEMMSNGFWGFFWASIGIAVLFIFIIGLFAFFMMLMVSPMLTVIKPYINSKYMVAFWRDYLEITKAIMEKNMEQLEESEG